MKKVIFNLMGAMLVVVPTSLLLAGFCLATGPVWDLSFFACAIMFLIYALRRYLYVKAEKEQCKIACFKLALFGTIVPLLLLLGQAIFCGLQGEEYLALEAAFIWLFIMMAVGIIDSLYRDRPKNLALTISIGLAACWLLICVIGGLFDFYENLTDSQIPEKLNDIVGFLSTCTVIGCVVMMAIGMIIGKRK